MVTVEQGIAKAEKILPGTPTSEGERDPRWQAIIAVGRFIETNPEEVWAFALKWGCHMDEDLRSAIATCLVEHLLEYDYDRIFPRVERAVAGSRLFEDMFCGCAKFGQAEKSGNSERFDRLMSKCRLAK